MGVGGGGENEEEEDDDDSSSSSSSSSSGSDSESDSDEDEDVERGGSLDEDSDASSVSSEEDDEGEDGLLASLIDRTILPIYDAAVNKVALPIVDRISQTSFAQWANVILDFVHESATGRGGGGEGGSLLHGSRDGAAMPPLPPKHSPIPDDRLRHYDEKKTTEGMGGAGGLLHLPPPPITDIMNKEN